jgi:hypothetical protein
LQELVADLQAPWPLQALMPEHITSADWVLLLEVEQPAIRSSAAAAARDAPEIVRMLLIVSLPCNGVTDRSSITLGSRSGRGEITGA